MVNLNLFQLVLSQRVVDVDLLQFGGGGAGNFFKINPYFLQCLAFFAFGAKASGYKKRFALWRTYGAFVLATEGLDSQKREWRAASAAPAYVTIPGIF